MMERTVPTLLFVLIAAISEQARAEITVKPSDTEIIVGGSTYLNCSTSLAKEVHWYHVRYDMNDQRYVYYYRQLHSPYNERFQIEKNVTSGFCNIFIPRVELTDAGVYICQDDEGAGQVVSAQLIVLESAPVCSSNMPPDGVIGSNSCNLPPEKLQLSCSVSYRAKIPPPMEWRKIEGNVSITKGLTQERSGDRVAYHLTLPSEPSIDGSSYVCQTSMAQHFCISSAIKIIYAISNETKQQAKIGDTVECRANSNQRCNYKWKWFRGEDTLTVSNDQTLTPDRPGNFRCEAECNIKKRPCVITAMLVYVEGSDATSAPSTTNLAPGYVALIVICIVLLFAAIIAILTVYLLKKRRMSKRLRRLNGDIPMDETETLLQSFTKGSDDIDISKLLAGLPYIDKGASGEVHGPCQFQKMTCAFQRILFSPIKLTEDMQKEILDKANDWKKLEHTNIVKFYAIRFDAPALYVIMDYAVGGTVRKILDTCTEDLPINVVSNWALQIAKGMEYLHANNTIHKHLKSAQILVMEPFDALHCSQKTLKIASYKLTAETIQSAPWSFKGMFAWASPETIQQQEFSKASDVWSYGVTAWELLTREIPYKRSKQAEILRKVSAGNIDLTIPPSCSITLRSILKDCWTIEPDRRPDFSNIVSRLNDIIDGRTVPELICNDKNFVDKGISGEIFGPFLFRGNRCACERIVQASSKVSSITESDICEQANRWMELDHQHVLKFYDVRFEAPALYVVMDYAEGGSVRKALDSSPEDLEVNVIRDWALQIAEGMNYLHSKDITHKRLKASQVLIMEPFDPSIPPQKTLKIASYRLTMDSDQSVQMSFKGMFAWMAPETIQRELNCKASDVWSYGITVWEILTRKIPYKGLKQSALLKIISDGIPNLPVSSQWPDTIHRILNGCWGRDMNERLTFPQIVSRLSAADDCGLRPS